MQSEIIFFGSFILFVSLMLAIDLGLFHKKDKAVTLSQAAIMSAVWVTCALAFYFLLKTEGHQLHNITNMGALVDIVKANKHHINLIPGSFEQSVNLYNDNLALEFITGYIVEYALSVDNIFVMVLIFSAFKVNEKYYHRVLFWGILGAVILRFVFIFLGAALVNNFGWLLYLFGAFLVYSGTMLLFTKEEDNAINPDNHKVVKFASKYFSVWPEFIGNKFFTKQNGKRYITPLFIVLLIVEFTDVIFAVDSIPAIFAITKDAYIVFFSNIFAILGLRSMFFLLVNIIHKFHYLQTGLAILLIFIGVKMLGEHWLKEWGFTTSYSLFVILLILVVSVGASLIFPKKHNVG